MSMVVNPFWFGGGGGGELDPTTILTCTEWVSADQPQWAGFSDGQAIGDATHRWEDRTGSGRYWEQGTAGARPTLHLTGGPNGKPYISFDSSDHLIFSNGASTILDGDGWCMFMVVRPQRAGSTSGTEGGPNIYTNGGYVGVALFSSGGNNKFSPYHYTGSYNRANSTTNYVTNTWYIVECWYDNTNINIRVNGDTTASAATGNPLSLADTASIGTATPCEMDYAERITYDSNISSTDRDSLRASLAAKYGITLP
jgi:hypothetical protein